MSITIRLVSTPSRADTEFCARLYNANQYLGPDGTVNPYDQRYMRGGVHFQRTPEWFEEQLALPGARLLIVEQDGVAVGYSLHFVDAENFPQFAADCLQYRDVTGIDRELAYTYLFVLDDSVRGQGIGWQLMDAIRADCASQGCVAIAHEHFIAPVINVSSAVMHGKMVERYGAVDTGRLADHQLRSGVKIIYAQFLIPTRDGIA